MAAATQKRLSARLELETLEDRLALSGNVTVSVSGGNLRIVGDNLGNGVMITQAPGSYGYTITGMSSDPTGAPAETTTVNGQASVTVYGVRENFDIRLRGGNDFLWLNGGTPGIGPRVVVPDILAIDAGDGNDRVRLTNTVVSSQTAINLGNGNDFLVVRDTLFVNNIALYGGSGFDRIFNLGGNVVLKQLRLSSFEG